MTHYILALTLLLTSPHLLIGHFTYCTGSGNQDWNHACLATGFHLIRIGQWSVRLVYCGPENWSDVGQYESYWKEVLHGNPSMRLIYSFAPLNYLWLCTLTFYSLVTNCILALSLLSDLTTSTYWTLLHTALDLGIRAVIEPVWQLASFLFKNGWWSVRLVHILWAQKVVGCWAMARLLCSWVIYVVLTTNYKLQKCIYN